MKALKNIILIVFLVCSFSLQAVEPKSLPQLLPTKIENGDTIPYVYLRDVYVFPPLKFTSKAQEKFYWRTVRDVKKTLPYAKMAGVLINETNQKLSELPTDKARNEYLKQKEKELFGKFEADLKKMTISQGRMLMRLVDRECNQTTYEVIRMYKGNLSALFWQGIARIFGSNLKEEYDGSDKDKIIERVIILVEAGQL